MAETRGRGRRALTVGGAVIDTLVTIASDRIEQIRMRNAEAAFLLVEEGRKVEAESITQSVGGGAVNTAVAIARLGFETAIICKLGHDPNAEAIRAKCRAEGIATDYIAGTREAATGSSVVIASHDRNSGIFTARGANTLLQPEDLDPRAFAVDLVYVAGLSNESADCFAPILELACRAGAMTVANPGIRQLSSRLAPFLESLALIDVLVMNRVEAESLVPALIVRGAQAVPHAAPAPARDAPLTARGLKSGGLDVSLQTFVGMLTRFGPKVVVVTNGGDGAYAGTAETLFHCPIAKVEVAGTAGAGDAFASTFAAFLAEGAEPDEALKAATLNAASVVSFIDTQTGLLRRSELDERLRSSDLKTESWPVR